MIPNDLHQPETMPSRIVEDNEEYKIEFNPNLKEMRGNLMMTKPILSVTLIEDGVVW